MIVFVYLATEFCQVSWCGNTVFGVLSDGPGAKDVV